MVRQQLDTRSGIRASADLLQPRAACSRLVLAPVPAPLPVVALPSSHPRKQLLFVLLSLADLLLTWWLLDHSSGQVYESNPIAHWWLRHHGWLGMIAFKAGVVLLVLALAVVISRSRPRSGGFVLRFACAALVLVVFYSASLCQTVPRNSLAGTAAERMIEDKMQQARAYRATLTALCEELIAGRCTLPQAAERLGKTAQGNDPAWHRTLATVNPGRSFQESLAGDIICFAVSSRTNAEAAQQLLAHFERDYALTYGRPILRHRIAHLMGTGTAGDRTGGSPATTENGPEVSAAL